MDTHEEGDEDGSIHEHKSQDRRPAVSEAVGDGTRQEDANKGAALPRLEQGTLPSGGDGVTGTLDVDPVLFRKCGERNEVTVEEHIKGLHDLARHVS